MPILDAAGFWEKAMKDEEVLTYPPAEVLGAEPRTSMLAVVSLVFGVLGPFLAGAMWIVSFNDFIAVENKVIVGILSCGAAWILGLIFGVTSLEQIDGADGRLVGREYATAGIVVSAAWMILIVTGLLMPALFCVNS
jgi:hypothetical protein